MHIQQRYIARLEGVWLLTSVLALCTSSRATLPWKVCSCHLVLLARMQSRCRLRMNTCCRRQGLRRVCQGGGQEAAHLPAPEAGPGRRAGGACPAIDIQLSPAALPRAARLPAQAGQGWNSSELCAGTGASCCTGRAGKKHQRQHLWPAEHCSSPGQHVGSQEFDPAQCTVRDQQQAWLRSSPPVGLEDSCFRFQQWPWDL